MPQNGVNYKNIFYNLIHAWILLWYNFFAPGTTAQQPLQHPGLLPEKAQHWLTGGGTNRLERSGGLGSSPPRLIDTSLWSPRKPHPFPSIHKDTASGMAYGPFFSRSPNTHITHTLVHTFLTNQPTKLWSLRWAGPGALASVIGDRLTWLSQWGAIVSYGNVLQSWGQEPRKHTRTRTYVILLSCRSWQVFQIQTTPTNTHTHTDT